MFLETQIAKRDTTLIKLSLQEHIYAQYISSALLKEAKGPRMIYQLPNDHYLLIKTQEPFSFLTLYNKASLHENAESLLDSLQFRLSDILAKKNYKFEKEDKESLFDYMQKIVNFYSDTFEKDYSKTSESVSVDYEILEINNDQSTEQSFSTSSKSRIRRSVKRTTRNHRLKNKVESKKNENRWGVRITIVGAFVLLGYVFAIYNCGGYSLTYCRS